MALVLKKAVFSKNTSLLRCMKGRHFLSTANKKPAITSAAYPRRRLKEKSLLSGWISKFEELSRPKRSGSDRCLTTQAPRARCAFSCPDLTRPDERLTTRLSASTTHLSTVLQPFVTPARNITTLTQRPAPRPALPNLVLQTKTALQPKTPIVQSDRGCACKCGSCCPFPCGPYGNCAGCGCLPPPCNCPPKCIQYMTGYYYYPYGFWFCGPYHVTGLCCPVSGSCPCGCGCGSCGKCCSCCLCPDIAGAALAATVPGTPSIPPTPSAPTKKKEASSFAMNFFPFSTVVTPSSSTTKSSPKKVVQSALEKKKELNIADNRGGSAHRYSTMSDYNNHVSTRTDKKGPHLATMKPYLATMKPRKIHTVKERDQPNIYPGQFHLGSIPKFKNPYKTHKSLFADHEKVEN